MRQGRTLLSVLLALIVAVPMHAVERTLIDFTTFNENIGTVVDRNQQLYEEIIAANPEKDIRNFGYPEFVFSPDDWNIDKWRVVLNPSADSPLNRINSIVTNAPSERHGNVMGVRLRFEPWSNPFWAEVRMPYTLSATYADGTYISETDNTDNGLAIGVLANVGQIRNVRSWVYGVNYDYTYGVRILDQDYNMTEFGMGSIYYEGWRRTSWNNPYYIADINKIPVYKNPLYPHTYPHIELDSLVFYKPDGSTNPNFIGYVRDVTVDYDLALVQEEMDINNEAVWGILGESAINKTVALSRRISEELLLRRNLERTQAEARGEGDDTAAAEEAPAEEAATEEAPAN